MKTLAHAALTICATISMRSAQSIPGGYVNGEEFVTVAFGGGERGRRGGDLILRFALPGRVR